MKLRKLFKNIQIAICGAAIGFAMSGCDIAKYSTNGEYQEKHYTSENAIDKIVIENNRIDTIFTVSEDNQFHVTCYENYKYKFKITESQDGVLSIKKQDLKKLTIFELPSDLQEVKIAVPQSFKGNIEVTTERAKLLFGNINAGNIEIENYRGEIELDKVQALENIILKCERDTISIKDTKIGKEISATNRRGNIDFENLEFGSDLKIKNHRGDIRGDIKGVITDYSITSKIERGKSNLPSNMSGGKKNVQFENSRGDIEVNFIE